jgi:hypothetical protein
VSRRTFDDGYLSWPIVYAQAYNGPASEMRGRASRQRAGIDVECSSSRATAVACGPSGVRPADGGGAAEGGRAREWRSSAVTACAFIRYLNCLYPYASSLCLRHR